MTKNYSMRTGPSRVAAAARVDPVASATCVSPVSSCFVPSRPATLCNHKANKAGKVLERDREEEQKPKHLAELTLVLPF